jgi:hypothetical protein
MVGQLQAIASTNKATAAAYAAKDFNYVFSTENVGTFLPQAQTFLTDMMSDIQRFNDLQKNVSDISYAILKDQAVLDVAKKLYGFSDADINNLMPPELLGQIKAAQQDYANSLAILTNEVVVYTERIDDQAKTLLNAWDATKKAEATTQTFAIINLVIDVLTSFGIGGNAVAQTIFKDWKDATKRGARYDRIWNGIGLRSGQVGDALQTALNTGIWLNKLNGVKTMEEVYDKWKDRDISTGENLQKLLDRVRDYEEQERKRQEPSEPNPFIPV